MQRDQQLLEQLEEDETTQQQILHGHMALQRAVAPGLTAAREGSGGRGPVAAPAAGGGGGGAVGAAAAAAAAVAAAVWGEGRLGSAWEMGAKAVMQSKNHSEAERRRRERINTHLATLRSLMPSSTKPDKASLLAAVVDRLQHLQRQQQELETSFGPMPSDRDEVTVSLLEEDTDRKQDSSHEQLRDKTGGSEAAGVAVGGDGVGGNRLEGVGEAEGQEGEREGGGKPVVGEGNRRMMRIDISCENGERLLDGLGAVMEAHKLQVEDVSMACSGSRVKYSFKVTHTMDGKSTHVHTTKVHMARSEAQDFEASASTAERAANCDESLPSGSCLSLPSDLPFDRVGSVWHDDFEEELQQIKKAMEGVVERATADVSNELLDCNFGSLPAMWEQQAQALGQEEVHGQHQGWVEASFLNGSKRQRLCVMASSSSGASQSEDDMKSIGASK